jgi:hypothetical protein
MRKPDTLRFILKDLIKTRNPILTNKTLRRMKSLGLALTPGFVKTVLRMCRDSGNFWKDFINAVADAGKPEELADIVSDPDVCSSILDQSILDGTRLIRKMAGNYDHTPSLLNDPKFQYRLLTGTARLPYEVWRELRGMAGVEIGQDVVDGVIRHYHTPYDTRWMELIAYGMRPSKGILSAEDVEKYVEWLPRLHHGDAVEKSKADGVEWIRGAA